MEKILAKSIIWIFVILFLGTKLNSTVRPVKGQFSPPQVKGYLWDDLNANGLRETSESALPNVAIELWKDDQIASQSATDANGFYSLSPNNYFEHQVKVSEQSLETVLSEYEVTLTPLDHNQPKYQLDNDFTASASAKVMVGPLSNQPSQVDGGFHKKMARIEGHYYLDWNLNGAFDDGLDLGIYSSIKLYSPDDRYYSANVLDTDGGWFSFRHLLENPNPYFIDFHPTPVTSEGLTHAVQDQKHILISSTSTINYDVPHVYEDWMQNNLSIQLYEDKNANGQQDKGELLLDDDFQITLQHLAYQLKPIEATGSAGVFQYEYMIPGEYSVEISFATQNKYKATSQDDFSFAMPKSDFKVINKIQKIGFQRNTPTATPIVMSVFSAKGVGNRVKLIWSTSEENIYDHSIPHTFKLTRSTAEDRPALTIFDDYQLEQNPLGASYFFDDTVGKSRSKFDFRTFYYTLYLMPENEVVGKVIVVM